MRKHTVLAVLCSSVIATSVFAHCQVPCGIYGDAARFDALREDFSTIEKAMNQIQELSKQDDENYNQIVRWVTTKEDHAQMVQQTVLDYFLAQRIKPDQENYEKRLVLLHGIIVSAMKCKQTTDVANVAALREKLDAFEALYFGKDEKAHMEEEHGEHKH